MMSTNNGNQGTEAVDASHLYQQETMEDEQNAASSVPTGNSGKGSTSNGSDAVAVTINNNNITADNDHESLQTTAMAMATARKNERRRIALFVFACFYTFLFVGSFFGWGPMQLLVSA